MLNQKRQNKAKKFGLMVFKVREDYIFRNLQPNVHTTRVLNNNQLLTAKSLFAEERQVAEMNTADLSAATSSVIQPRSSTNIQEKSLCARKHPVFTTVLQTFSKLIIQTFRWILRQLLFQFSIQVNFKSFDSTVKMFCKQVFDQIAGLSGVKGPFC